MKLKSLSQREKIIVGAGAAVLVLLFVWFAVFIPYLDTVKKLDRKIVAHKKNLVKVGDMKVRF